MKKFIIENFVASDKLAVINDGELDDLIVENKSENKKVRNIYRGKIEKVIPTMKACFVDIGEDSPGYLKIENEMKAVEGENLMVQITKEEKGDKRVKLSSEISLSGRYLVYIPTNTKIVFSSKIKNKDEKRRLREELLKVSEGEKGFIIRSEAEGVSSVELKKDLEDLKMKYNFITEEYKKSFYPKLLYTTEGRVIEYIRENFNESVEKIIYPDGELDRKIRDTIKKINPAYLERLKRESNLDIFESYGVNKSMKKYLTKNVWLKSGAYIVIDKTEAMTVIDVNTGSFKGNSKYEDTVFKTNMEAADEISRQIFMRDISGIIIVDFIDMKEEKNRKKLLERLSKNLQIEGKRAKVHGFTRLGLVEISRMRKKDTIENYFSSPLRKIDKIEQETIYEKYHKGSVEFVSDVVIEEEEKEMASQYIQRLEQKYKIKINLK